MGPETAAETTPPNPAPAPATPPPPPATPAESKWFTRALQFTAVTIVGVLIGIPIQCGVEKTGLLGPPDSDQIQALIQEQSAALADIQAKIDALRQSATADPDTLAQVDALQAALDRQVATAERTHAELNALYAELERVKAQALESQQYTGGANVWLAPGESVTIHRPGHTLAFESIVGTLSDDALVRIDGEEHRLDVGASIDVPTNAGTYRVVFKQLNPRADGRYGFDLVPPAGADPQP